MQAHEKCHKLETLGPISLNNCEINWSGGFGVERIACEAEESHNFIPTLSDLFMVGRAIHA